MNKIDTTETEAGAFVKNSLMMLINHKDVWQLEIALGLSADDGHPDLLYRIDGEHRERQPARNAEEARKPRYEVVEGWGVLNEDDPAFAVSEIGEADNWVLVGDEATRHGADILRGVADTIRDMAGKYALSDDWEGLANWICSVVERAETWQSK